MPRRTSSPGHLLSQNWQTGYFISFKVCLCCSDPVRTRLGWSRQQLMSHHTQTHNDNWKTNYHLTCLYCSYLCFGFMLCGAACICICFNVCFYYMYIYIFIYTYCVVCFRLSKDVCLFVSLTCILLFSCLFYNCFIPFNCCVTRVYLFPISHHVYYSSRCDVLVGRRFCLVDLAL